MYEGAIVFDENTETVVDHSGHVFRYLDAWVHLPITAAGKFEPKRTALLYHNPNAWYAVRGTLEDKTKSRYPPYSGHLSDYGRQILFGFLKGRMERWKQLGTDIKVRPILSLLEFLEFITGGIPVEASTASLAPK